MKLKNTLLLLLVAMGAFAFIWFYERHQKSTKELVDESTLVAKFDRDKVTGIMIKTNEGKIEMKKDEKGIWQLSEPIEDRADSLAVAQLFTESEALRFVDKIDDKGKGIGKDKLKDYGLSDPATKVRFTGKEKQVEIQFGKDTATEGRQYVKVDGSNVVYVIGGQLKSTLAKKADEFRDKKLSDLQTTQVHKVTLKTQAGEIGLAKGEDGHWSLVKPLKARGDDARIGDLISLAANARVEAFVTEPAKLNASGLQEPRATLTLYSAGAEKPTVLEIGAHPKEEADKEKAYARLSTRDAVVLLPKSIEKIVVTKPNDLRDRQIVRIENDIVDRMTIEGPGREKIVLARSGEAWVRKAGGKDVPVNVPAAHALLGMIGTQKVAEFVADVASDLPKYGLDQPAAKVTLSSYASENTAETTAGDKPIVTVLFGKTDGENVYAKLDDEPFIVAVTAAILEQMPRTALEWQPLEIVNQKPEEIVALEVAREGQPVISLERDKETNWKLAKGDGAVNQTNAGSLVNTLAGLNAVRWLGPSTAEHGLEKPAIAVTFKTAAGASGKLRIGSEAPGEMWHGSADGLTGTFLLNRPDKTAFDAALLEKPAPAAPAPAPPAAEPAKDAAKPATQSEAPPSPAPAPRP